MNLIPRDSLLSFDNLFDNLMTTPRRLTESSPGFFSPRVDIRETDKYYEVSAELPGVEKKDLNVTLDDGMLTLEAELKQESKKQEGNWLRQERRYGKFQRSFSLQEDITEKEIEASFKDGILTLKIPRRAPKAKASHRVEIH